MAIVDATDPITDISDIQGLICIDCWDHPEVAESYYNQLKKFINFDQFQSIIVANYELTIDGKDVATSNTLNEYCWSGLTLDFVLPVVKYAGDKKTNRFIQQHFNKQAFLILDSNTFVMHLALQSLNIRNWLVIGGAWQHCTHWRPLGFTNLLKLPMNFYAREGLLIKKLTDEDMPVGLIDKVDFELDSLTWADQTNGLYLLQNRS